MTNYDENVLNSIELELQSPIKKSIIWLHGLGADGHDFVPFAHELHLPSRMGVRFIFPHAPIMPITINNGYEMRAWYDIYTLSLREKIDKEGIQKSVSEVHKLIEREVVKGMSTSDILLAGFSQGAAVALTSGIRYPKRLGGIIGLSGYLPSAEIISQNKGTSHYIPIFLAHGINDPIVPYQIGKATKMVLKEAGFNVDWHEYPIGHSVCKEEATDLSEWLSKTFENE